MTDSQDLRMEFDMNTIQHLGISMYSKLPPVLGEIVANAYDADAPSIVIEMNDQGEKYIKITDTGFGMTKEDINKKFLKIGRNKRVDEPSDITAGGRKVIGRKGIGKLSVFGIADDVIVTTTTPQGITNKFRMYLPDIIDTKDNIYRPNHLVVDESLGLKQGTIIELKNLRRKSPFDSEEVCFDLARRFLIYDKDFSCNVIHNGSEPKPVTNDMRFADLDIEFTWTFPDATLNSMYPRKAEVKGEVYSVKEKTMPEAMRGIYLVARKKLVNKNEFYGVRASDFAHAYLTGWLEVDFIDETKATRDDRLGTNRESLNWEIDECEDLRKYLQEMLHYVAQDWKKRKKEKKTKEASDKIGFDIYAWIEDLPAADRKLAKKMIGPILENTDISSEKTAELIGHIKDAFGFTSFRELAEDIEDNDEATIVNLVSLLKKWRIIEARELYKLALVRVKAITEFDKLIKTNAREVPTVHNFLRNFPWLLDPRIMNFEDEVTYSELLKTQFAEQADTPESDRRLDFLCVDFAENLFVIELKRPEHKANEKTLRQAIEYRAFLEKHFGNTQRRKIEVFIVCGGIASSPAAEEIADSHRQSGKVFVKSYHELLSQARKYHQEFIKAYEKMEAEETE